MIRKNGKTLAEILNFFSSSYFSFNCHIQPHPTNDCWVFLFLQNKIHRLNKYCACYIKLKECKIMILGQKLLNMNKNDTVLCCDLIESCGRPLHHYYYIRRSHSFNTINTPPNRKAKIYQLRRNEKENRKQKTEKLHIVIIIIILYFNCL